MTWSEMQPLLEQACTETLVMVGWSTLIAVVGGLPLGILLVLTDKGGLLQNTVVNKVIGQIVNVGRSLPFIILMVALMNFTRWVTGTTIGSEAAIVPLAIGGIPFFARLVETAVREVDHGLVEAVQAMGGNTWTIVRKVLVPEALPSLIASTTTTVIALIGYSAMAGTVGGGGLGDLAVRYGYQRFETGLMWITVAILAVVISLIQFAGDFAARALHRRGARSGPGPRLRLLKGEEPATAEVSCVSDSTRSFSRPDPQSAGFVFPAVAGRSDVSNLSGLSPCFPNRGCGTEFRHADTPKSFPLGGRARVWLPLSRRKCCRRTVTAPRQPEELYGSREVASSPPAQDLSVQVGQASAGVGLGVLHPAEQARQHLTEGGPLLRAEVLEEVRLEDGGHPHGLLPLLPAGRGELDDDAYPVVLVPLPGDQTLGDHPVDPVGHGGRGQAQALGEVAGAHPIRSAGEDERLEDLPVGVGDAELGGLAAVGDVHAAVEPGQRVDDLLDLGVEVLELALVRGDLLFEGRLFHAGGVGHARSMARPFFALKSFSVYSLASNFSF